MFKGEVRFVMGDGCDVVHPVKCASERELGALVKRIRAAFTKVDALRAKHGYDPKGLVAVFSFVVTRDGRAHIQRLEVFHEVPRCAVPAIKRIADKVIG